MTTATPKKKNNRKKVAASLALLLAAASALTITSLALFTDTETVSSNAFETGTLDLTVGTATALLTGTAMVPGDQVTSQLAVGNGGTVDFRYAMTSATTGDAALGAELVLTIKSGVAVCDDANWGTGGTNIYSGALNAGFFGNPAQGADPGDRNLTVLAGSENLCFNVTLPLTSVAQGVSVDTTFTFNAEQTANN